jgi:hypothetical protein
MDRVLIKIMKLTNFQLDDITPFDYKELSEAIVEEYVSVS